MDAIQIEQAVPFLRIRRDAGNDRAADGLDGDELGACANELEVVGVRVGSAGIRAGGGGWQGIKADTACGVFLKGGGNVEGDGEIKRGCQPGCGEDEWSRNFSILVSEKWGCK